MSKRSLLWACSIGFLLGNFLASVTGFGWPIGVSVLLFALSTIMLAREHYAIIIFCMLISMSVGVFRYEMIPELPTVRGSTSHSYVGDVIEEPKETESGTSFVVRLVATSSASRLKMYASILGNSDIRYGDRVSITRKLVSVQEEKVPDYWKTYLKTQGIGYEVKNARLTFIEHGHGNPLLTKLFSIKQFVISKIERSIPEPEAALLSGILLGARSTLGKELSDQFNKVGVSHIIALSGFNITIIATAIMYLFAQITFVPMTFGIYASGMVIILFVLMTGASASASRAAVMALILLLARREGRTYDAGAALIVAAVCMVLWNPFVLMNDFGFQLSFLAAVGIIWLMPLLEEKAKHIPKLYGLREVLLGTIAAEAMVMPLIIYKTGVVSLISLIANALILPVLPPLMALGGLFVIVALLGYHLALPFAWLTFLTLGYVIAVVDFLYQVPYAFIIIPSVSLVLVLVWYMLLIYSMLQYHVWHKTSETRLR